jgi:hypothetical protein
MLSPLLFEVTIKEFEIPTGDDGKAIISVLSGGLGYSAEYFDAH